MIKGKNISRPTCRFVYLFIYFVYIDVDIIYLYKVLIPGLFAFAFILLSTEGKRIM